MTSRLLLATIALAACRPAATYLVAQAPGRLAEADRLSSVPAIILVTPQDRRPEAERGGRAAEISFLFLLASTGGSISHAAGAAVLDGDDMLRWSNHGFPGGDDSNPSSVASDIGKALQSAAGRPIKYVVAMANAAAADAADGTVIATVVLDHATQITPTNADHNQTTRQQGNHQVTTTTSSSETFGSYWTFAFQIELGEVRDRRVARRLVLHVASSASSPTAYGDAVQKAATEVVHAVASEWSKPSSATPPFSPAPAGPRRCARPSGACGSSRAMRIRSTGLPSSRPATGDR